MYFECLGGVGGEGGSYLGSGVGERDVFVYEGDEATTTPACSVVSECCVSRKLWCMVSRAEFSFLDEGNMYVVLFENVFEFLCLVCDPVNIKL